MADVLTILEKVFELLDAGLPFVLTDIAIPDDVLRGLDGGGGGGGGAGGEGEAGRAPLSSEQLAELVIERVLPKLPGVSYASHGALIFTGV